MTLALKTSPSPDARAPAVTGPDGVGQKPLRTSAGPERSQAPACVAAPHPSPLRASFARLDPANGGERERNILVRNFLRLARAQ
jgi:hypothetical protein